jgi:transposase
MLRPRKIERGQFRFSRRVVVPQTITPWFQPPHSPEVNAMEQIWQ